MTMSLLYLNPSLSTHFSSLKPIIHSKAYKALHDIAPASFRSFQVKLFPASACLLLPGLCFFPLLLHLTYYLLLSLLISAQRTALGQRDLPELTNLNEVYFTLIKTFVQHNTTFVIGNFSILILCLSAY